MAKPNISNLKKIKEDCIDLSRVLFSAYKQHNSKDGSKNLPKQSYEQKSGEITNPKKMDIARWELEQDLMNKLRNSSNKEAEKKLIEIVNMYEGDTKVTPVINEVVARLNEKRLLMKELDYWKAISLVDPLIDSVFNYRFFNDTIKDLIKLSKKHSNKLSMTIFDIDKFKKINDTFGHPGGDYVLNTIVERAYNVIKDVDVFSRIGGDEFSIIFPDMNAKDCSEVCVAIKKEVQKAPIEYLGNNIEATLSMGFDQYKGLEQTAFHRRIDEYLYRAKDNGRDLIVGSLNNGESLSMYNIEQNKWIDVPKK